MTPPRLRTPEQLLLVGFERSRVVMVNEAHHDLLRCIRTRIVGRRLLPVAHGAGVRHLAMEALWDPAFVERANATKKLPEAGIGYLTQPEMRALIQDALDLGWTLLAYEANMKAAPSSNLMSSEVTAWREEEEAKNLVKVRPEAPLLVWCGWGHLSKSGPVGRTTMAQHFRELSGIEPFAIDQTTTIHSDRKETGAWLELFVDELDQLGDTGGFLTEDAPAGWRQRWADAFLLSLENDLV